MSISAFTFYQIVKKEKNRYRRGVTVIVEGNGLGNEFKSLIRIFAFYIALITLGKIQLFNLQIWMNSRTD